MIEVLDDRYELGERIGSGGAAHVHRAVDRRLGREVAVKVLDDLAASQADPAGRDRFVREARTAARLHHPHVVTVFDAGESNGRLFLVMELVEGSTLAEVIAERAPLATDEAARLAIQILGALAAAHRRDIVHRDVKPANVIVDEHGDAHLTDFGIAWRLDAIEEHLTSAGTVVGTPTYLAPEQATGRELGAATDVYLAGLVLDEMLTGRRTHGDAPPADTAAQLAAGAEAFDPRDVAPGTDDRLAEVVLRATDPEPSRRFASATEMIAAIAGRDVAPARSTVAPPVPTPPPATAPTPTMAMPEATVPLVAGAVPVGTAPTVAIAGAAPPAAGDSLDSLATTSPPDDGRGGLLHRRLVPITAAALVALLIVGIAALARDDVGESTPPGSDPAGPPVSATDTTPATVPPTEPPPPTTAAPDAVGGGPDGSGDGRGKEPKEPKKPKEPKGPKDR